METSILAQQIHSENTTEIHLFFFANRINVCLCILVVLKSAISEHKIHFKGQNLIFIHFHDSCYIPFPWYSCYINICVLCWKLNTDSIGEAHEEEEEESFQQSGGCVFGWCRCPLHSLHPFSTKSSVQCWLIPGTEIVSKCWPHPLESTFLWVLVRKFSACWLCFCVLFAGSSPTHSPSMPGHLLQHLTFLCFSSESKMKNRLSSAIVDSCFHFTCSPCNRGFEQDLCNSSFTAVSIYQFCTKYKKFGSSFK